MAELPNEVARATMDLINKEIPSCLPFENRKNAAMPITDG